MGFIVLVHAIGNHQNPSADARVVIVHWWMWWWVVEGAEVLQVGGCNKAARGY